MPVSRWWVIPSELPSSPTRSHRSSSQPAVADERRARMSSSIVCLPDRSYAVPVSVRKDLSVPPHFPGSPAQKLDVLEEAGGAGWVSYDCGGLTRNVAALVMRKVLWRPVPAQSELLEELAGEVYGKEGAEKALRGRRACSDSLQWFSGRNRQDQDHGA
jgi:hypothetical protein